MQEKSDKIKSICYAMLMKENSETLSSENPQRKRLSIRPEWLTKNWEELWKPKDIYEAIQKLDAGIFGKMGYDMVNYYAALALDRKWENTLLQQIDEEKLWISTNQLSRLNTIIERINKSLPEWDVLKQIIQDYTSTEPKNSKVVRDFLSNPSIWKIIGWYEREFTSIYRNKSIGEIRKEWVWNCIVFAEIAKTLLETAKYSGINLKIRRISYDPDMEFDHMKLIIHMENGDHINYDPTATFFRK
jgi:hypothetical protein